MILPCYAMDGQLMGKSWRFGLGAGGNWGASYVFRRDILSERRSVSESR